MQEGAGQLIKILWKLQELQFFGKGKMCHNVPYK